MRELDGRRERFGESPGSEMARALRSYARWLETILSSQGKVNQSGSDLVAAIRAIQRASFTDASRLMAELLLRHEEIATAMFDHRLRVLRLAVSEDDGSLEAVKLAARQLATVNALAGYCDHSSASVKRSSEHSAEGDGAGA